MQQLGTEFQYEEQRIISLTTFGTMGDRCTRARADKGMRERALGHGLFIPEEQRAKRNAEHVLDVGCQRKTCGLRWSPRRSIMPTLAVGGRAYRWRWALEEEHNAGVVCRRKNMITKVLLPQCRWVWR